MDRDSVIDQVLTAKTVQECKDARAVAKDYLSENPDDDGVRMSLESLRMVQEAPARP